MNAPPPLPAVTFPHRHLLGIEGLSAAESRAVLALLYEHIKQPQFQCRFRWQKNSIAFWDNRCVQHQAIWDYWPETRTGYRVTVKGDKPV